MFTILEGLMLDAACNPVYMWHPTLLSLLSIVSIHMLRVVNFSLWGQMHYGRGGHIFGIPFSINVYEEVLARATALVLVRCLAI